VNSHGSFWLSSRYRRYSWRQQPGDTWDENATGTLTSPSCTLEANFLTFRMSGGRSSSQRVELQVRDGNTQDYFGIRFPASLGDNTAGPSFGHATQFPPVPTVPQTFPPPTSGWTVLRSVTSEDVGETDWMQVYVFDIRQFRGSEVRIRVVDDARSQCLLFAESGACKQMGQEHINVDDFRFTDTAPDGTFWLAYDESHCGIPGAPDQCSPVGHVLSEPPLWGVTDAHAHPMANLAFGGHVVWGDIADKLEDVYDCTHNLPPIGGPGGRAAITKPASSTACYVSGDIDVLVASAVLAGCSNLISIPVAGPLLAGVCSVVIASAETALLTIPVIQGLRLHGANKLASGAVSLGPILSQSWLWALRLLAGSAGHYSLDFSTGLMPQFDAWPDAKPTLNWYPKDDWHSFTGLAKSHNLYQADMIRHAFQGGMRLGVWDVINSRALAFVADGETYSDWQALKDGTDAAKRIIASNLFDIATIAYTPLEAEQIIRAGRMAVILGSEVDELGRMRPDDLPWPRSPHTSGDSMQKQIDDLWELGIRKITPVHASNNPIGGPAIFSEKYVSLNHFLNATDVDGDPSVLELPAARFILDRLTIPFLPFRLILGDFKVFQDVGTNPPPDWNPDGWFALDTRPPTADGTVIIDPSKDADTVTFRIGEGSPKDKDGKSLATLREKDSGKWLPPGEVLGKQILIPTVIGAGMSTFIRPVGRCDLHNTVLPRFADSFGDNVNSQFTTAAGHRNALGLRDDGAAFLHAAMRKGMILDVDHMSQNMRIDVYQLASTYAAEASPNAAKACAAIGLSCGAYPFMGVHTTVRGLEKEGSDLEEFRMQYGPTDESTRTPSEIDHVITNGGTIGVFPRGSAFIPPNSQGGRCTRDTDCARWSPDPIFGESPICSTITHTCSVSTDDGLPFRDFDLPLEVTNDCDTTSKTFAVKYLWMMNRTKGHGLTLTTDLNGFIGTVNPRFGGATPGKDVCGGNKRKVLNPFVAWGGWGVILPEMQKQEHSGVWYIDYTAKATASDRATRWTDPASPFHKRWRQVIARGQNEVREDFAPRYKMDELVYFNDHGPDLPIRHWYDQDGNVRGSQMFSMKRWQNRLAGWDFNLDGLQHIGLLPDMIQDMRNVGVQWEQLSPMFHGAQEFITLWKRSVAIGTAHP
jgi:hypothetical protein